MPRADFIRFEPHQPAHLPPPGGHRTRCERATATLTTPHLVALGVACLEHARGHALETRHRAVIDGLGDTEQLARTRALLAELKRVREPLESDAAQRRLATTHALESLVLATSSPQPAREVSFALGMLVAASDLAFTELAWQAQLLGLTTGVEPRIVQLIDWAPASDSLSLDEFVSGSTTRRLAGPPNVRIARWLDAAPRGCVSQFCQQLFATTVRELVPLLDDPQAIELVRTLELARTPDAAVRCLIERWIRSDDLVSRRAHALRAVADASRALVHPEAAPMHASDAIKLRAAAAENHVTSWVDSINLLLACTDVTTRPW